MEGVPTLLHWIVFGGAKGMVRNFTKMTISPKPLIRFQQFFQFSVGDKLFLMFININLSLHAFPCFMKPYKCKKVYFHSKIDINPSGDDNNSIMKI